MRWRSAPRSGPSYPNFFFDFFSQLVSLSACQLVSPLKGELVIA